MAYPPDLPPSTRNDATAQAGAHADDHNTLAAALADIVDVLGPDPVGDYADLTTRLGDFAPSLEQLEDAVDLAHESLAQDALPTGAVLGSGTTVLTDFGLTLDNPGTTTKWRVDLTAQVTLTSPGGGVGPQAVIRLRVDGVPVEPPLVVTYQTQDAGDLMSGTYHLPFLLEGLAEGDRVLTVTATKGASTGSASVGMGRLLAQGFNPA